VEPYSTPNSLLEARCADRRCADADAGAGTVDLALTTGGTARGLGGLTAVVVGRRE
jgi:hypothetical protein